MVSTDVCAETQHTHLSSLLTEDGMTQQQTHSEGLERIKARTPQTEIRESSERRANKQSVHSGNNNLLWLLQELPGLHLKQILLPETSKLKTVKWEKPKFDPAEQKPVSCQLCCVHVGTLPLSNQR